MITINLLPYELRPIKRTPLPYILCIALLVLAVGACFQVYIEDTLQLSDIQTTMAKNEEELNSLMGSVEEYNALSDEKMLLATQLETIHEIANDRIIWSRQLHNLTRLSADKNMWFHEIKVEQRPYTVTESVFDPATNKTTEKRVRKYQPVLKLRGYVASGTDGRATISLFMDAAENDEEFSSLFSPESPAFSDTEFNETTVREFTLQYVISNGVQQ